MTFASTESRPSTNFHSTKINDDKSLWGHFPCRILLCYKNPNLLFSSQNSFGYFPCKILLCHLLQNPKSALSLSLRMNLSNPKPQKQHPPTRKAWESPQILATKLQPEAISSSLFFSTPNKTLNQATEAAKTDKRNRKKRGRRGRGGRGGGEELQREKKKKSKKRN